MPLNKTELLPGMPGYWEKNNNRYRFCNNFHDEGFRCTRPMNHAGPHAAHTTRGGATKINKNEQGEITTIDTEKDVNVQIATW
jgi:hypothetical protein